MLRGYLEIEGEVKWVDDDTHYTHLSYDVPLENLIEDIKDYESRSIDNHNITTQFLLEKGYIAKGEDLESLDDGKIEEFLINNGEEFAKLGLEKFLLRKYNSEMVEMAIRESF